MKTRIQYAVIEVKHETAMRILESGSPLEYFRHHCEDKHGIARESVNQVDVDALRLLTECGLRTLEPLKMAI